MSTASVLSWTFAREVKPPQHILEFLIQGEEAVAAFQTIRDTAVFTNKRLIVIDSQGVTGIKKEVFCLPYKSIIMWSTENAGLMDFDAEVSLWTKHGHININLKRSIDVAKFDRLLASVCL